MAGGVQDLATHLPGEALGWVVVCSRAVKSKSCVRGVRRCTCGLSELLNKRNSSLADVSAAARSAGGVTRGTCRGDSKGSGTGLAQLLPCCG